MSKPYARQFYSSKEWQDCRNDYGTRHSWLCEDCLERGRYTPGIEVHHIEELKPWNINRPEVTLNFDNLVLLCRECHKARHKGNATGRRYFFDEITGEVHISDPPDRAENDAQP